MTERTIEERARIFADSVYSLLGCGCCGGAQWEEVGVEGLNELIKLAQGLPKITSYKFHYQKASRIEIEV